MAINVDQRISKYMGDGMNREDAARMANADKSQEENRAYMDAQFALQQKVNKESLEANTRSNIEKSKHDAMMSIANNMK